MKITEIRTFLMQAGQPPESAWATDGISSQGSRNWLFVKVYTDEGITGVGEGSGWPRVVEAAVNDLAHIVVGEDPRNIERLWQKMHVAMMGHGISGVIGAGAMAGIDMALWDIKGKALNTPVWNLLGGKVRDRIRLYSHASTPEVAVSLKERGYTAVKSGGVGDPLGRVDAIRKAVGDDMDIMLDLHGPPWLTPKDAVILGKALEPYNLLFYEEPLPPEDPDALARVQDQVAIPLAAGERLATIWGWRHLIERGIVDVIQPDTGRGGGLTQLKKVAAMAEAHFITVAPHSGTLGPVAEYAAIHLLAAIPNALILERLEDDWPGRTEVTDPVPKAENGYVAVPDTPGLGVDINEDFVARHPSTRNVFHPDGQGLLRNRDGGEHVYVQARFGRAKYFKGGDGS